MGSEMCIRDRITRLTISPVQPQTIVVRPQAKGEGLKRSGRDFLIELCLSRASGAEFPLQLVDPQFELLKGRLAGLVCAGGGWLRNTAADRQAAQSYEWQREVTAFHPTQGTFASASQLRPVGTSRSLQ